MLTHQTLGSNVHGSIIQDAGRGNPVSGKRVRLTFLENIQVTPACRRKPRMKIIRHPTNPMDTHRRGKMGIQAFAPCIRRALMRGDEADDLVRCVHSGVGPTGCSKLRSLRLNFSQRGFKRVLYSKPISLGLESLKGITCIGDAQRQSMTQDARLSSKERARSFCA